MVQFRYLYAIASDGQLKIKNADNGPTKEQQQQQWKSGKDGKRTMDYYRQLTRADSKYVDWLQKLGCMAARELMKDEWATVSTDSQKSFLLHDFPAGFTLWEHIKKSETADGAAKTTRTKSHAGGGHDRMDAYLYGHPHGKKRFRSPGEFFPHLLWLLTDESKDHDKCRCVCCCPDVLQPVESRAGSAKAEKKSKALENQSKSPQQKAQVPVKVQNVAVVVPITQTMNTLPEHGQAGSGPGPVPTRSAASQVQGSPKIPQHTPSEMLSRPQTAATPDNPQNIAQQQQQYQYLAHHQQEQQRKKQQQQQQQQQSHAQRTPQPRQSTAPDTREHLNQPSAGQETQANYDSYSMSQYNQYQSHGPEPQMFEMPSQSSDQMEFNSNNSYHQFSGMDYNSAQYNYRSMPVEQQYDQYLLQQTQDQTGFNGNLDPNQGFLDDLHQWSNMPGQYGQGPPNEQQ